MSAKDTDIDWMKRALAIAREADASSGKNPIGCVIVRDGRIIGEACNEVDIRHDATAHAEILAMRRAGKTLKFNELRCGSLLDLAAVRDVHHGFHLGQDRPHRLWCRS
jgi:tRNA(Arg) A34 adenosine deaminase TadA